MYNTVASFQVIYNYLRIIDEYTIHVDHYFNILALQCCNHLTIRKVTAHYSTVCNMVKKDVCKRTCWVFKQFIKKSIRKKTKCFICWSKYSEWTITRKRSSQIGRNYSVFKDRVIRAVYNNFYYRFRHRRKQNGIDNVYNTIVYNLVGQRHLRTVDKYTVHVDFDHHIITQKSSDHLAVRQISTKSSAFCDVV